MSWLKWAIGTAFLWAIQSVSTYYFTTITLINSVAVNTFTRGIGLLCVICYIVISGLSSKVQKDAPPRTAHYKNHGPTLPTLHIYRA